MLAVLALLIALPGAAAAIHLGVLSAASLFYRQPIPPGRVPRVRFCVMVPAHNEERVLGQALEAIEQQLRSDDLLIVVADRCTDDTAAIARSHGALVVERPVTATPVGRAAARQAGIDFARGLDWDVMVMIDADSRIEPGFLAACEAMLAQGAQALQARTDAEPDNKLLSHTYVAAFALLAVTQPRGLDRLGLSVRIRGTGMVLRRRLVEQYQFRAPASEDLCYGLDLCLDGIIARHVESARLRFANVRSLSAASSQRLRYEAGRMSAARTYLLPLLRRHSPSSLQAALHLATPPVALAVASLLSGAAMAALGGAITLAYASLVCLGLLGFSLGVALVQLKAGPRTWLALLSVPWYVVWKLWVQLKAIATIRRSNVVYGPTPRG